MTRTDLTTADGQHWRQAVESLLPAALRAPWLSQGQALCTSPPTPPGKAPPRSGAASAAGPGPAGACGTLP
jgi:hypothetical protein